MVSFALKAVAIAAFSNQNGNASMKEKKKNRIFCYLTWKVQPLYSKSFHQDRIVQIKVLCS